MSKSADPANHIQVSKCKHCLHADVIPKLLFALSIVVAVLGLSIEPANAQISLEGSPVPPEGLRVGSELLSWGNEGGARTLTHAGRPIVSTFDGYATPFTILDTWNSPETSAVLLQAGVAATKDCSTIYVVENRQPRSVAAHELGAICVSFDKVRVERNEQGFVFAYTPLPKWKASAKQWQARTGDVATTEIAFRPEPDSTMAGLVSAGRPELAEPLLNTEFFTAVSRVPAPQRERLLAALWQVTNGCSGCSGSADQRLYGVAIDNRTAAYSGCGWYMNGARVNCGESDALAVWDREGGGFYFATDVHRKEGIHDDAATLTTWPALQAWPPAARDRFEAWRNGRVWPTENR